MRPNFLSFMKKSCNLDLFCHGEAMVRFFLVRFLVSDLDH